MFTSKNKFNEQPKSFLNNYIMSKQKKQFVNDNMVLRENQKINRYNNNDKNDNRHASIDDIQLKNNLQSSLSKAFFNSPRVAQKYKENNVYNNNILKTSNNQILKTSNSNTRLRQKESIQNDYKKYQSQQQLINSINKTERNFQLQLIQQKNQDNNINKKDSKENNFFEGKDKKMKHSFADVVSVNKIKHSRKSSTKQLDCPEDIKLRVFDLTSPKTTKTLKIQNQSTIHNKEPENHKYIENDYENCQTLEEKLNFLQRRGKQQIPSGMTESQISDITQFELNFSQIKTQYKIFQKDDLFQKESFDDKQKVQGKLDQYITKVSHISLVKENKQQQQQLQQSVPKSFLQYNNRVLYYVSYVIRAFIDLEVKTTANEIARDHLLQTMNALKLSKNFVTKFVKPVYLPKTTRKTIIFDLDETLIHCVEVGKEKSHIQLPVTFPNGETIKAGINIRPYAQEVLRELSKQFEIIVFTASHACYANTVIDNLDPNHYISHRFYREHCVQTQTGIYTKDLKVLGNRDLNNLILIDNAAYSYGLQINNGIPIIPYYNDESDCQLKDLQHYLQRFLNVKDVREEIKDNLKLEKYSTFNDQVELIKNLYSKYV